MKRGGSIVTSELKNLSDVMSDKDSRIFNEAIKRKISGVLQIDIRNEEIT